MIIFYWVRCILEWTAYDHEKISKNAVKKRNGCMGSNYIRILNDHLRFGQS